MSLDTLDGRTSTDAAKPVTRLQRRPLTLTLFPTGVRSKRSGAANIPTSCPQDTAGAGVFTSPGAGELPSSRGSSGAYLSSSNVDLDSSDDDDLDPRMAALLASPRDDSGVGLGRRVAERSTFRPPS